MSPALEELSAHARELTIRHECLALRVAILEHELDALRRDIANRRRRWWRK